MRLLGGFEVVLPDGRVAGPWVRPTARRVFQILVLREKHRVGREELTELLFPDVAPDRARSSLSKALSMARAALAPFDIVCADRDVIWLDAEIEVDAEKLRCTLRRAMALSPGSARDAALVSGLEESGRLLDGELYADWASEARDELEGLRASARLTLARDRSAGHGRAGTWDSVEAWRDVLAHDPANEEACAAALRATGAARMRDMAVRTYHRTVAALHDLGLEPSAVLQAAYSEAMKDAVDGAPVPDAVQSNFRAFGRDAALGILRELVGKQQRDSCGALLLSGPAGIGKTHLLDFLGRELHATGWQVVQTAAARDDRRAPLRALRSILAQLDGSDAGPLVRLVAEGAGSPDAVERSSAVRRRFIDELVAHLDGQARTRPLVLMIDDLQWTDAALQQVLVELVERRRSRRWVMLLAGRTDEAGMTVAVRATVANLELEPLSRDGVDALVRHTAPGLDEQAVAMCVARSGGNPFFAVELARQQAVSASGTSSDRALPASIIALLDSRLARCSPEARRLLSLVALWGEASSIESLLHLGERPQVGSEADATIRAIDELVDAHLLDERVGDVRLVHPLLRDAAVARLDRAGRAALHGIIAAASTAEVAARHRLAAFEASGLCVHARQAADAGFLAGHHARRLFADDAALELFEGGLQAFAAATEDDRHTLRGAALDAWCQLGDIHLQREARTEAELAFQAAAALAVCDDERAQVWNAMASLAYRVGDFQQCVTLYEQGIAALREGSPAARARLEAELGWTYFRLGRTEESVDLLDRATKTLNELGDALTRGHALDRFATVLGVVGRAEEGLAVMERAFEAVGPTGDERELGILHVHRATLYKELRRYGEALADAAASLRVATVTADAYVQSVVHWVTGSVHEMRGDPSAALAEREKELVLLKGIGNVRNSAMAHAARARLLRALGRSHESEEAAEMARRLADAQGDDAFSTRIEQQLMAAGPTG